MYDKTRPWRSLAPKDKTTANIQVHRQMVIAQIADLNFNLVRENITSLIKEDVFHIFKSLHSIESFMKCILVINLSRSIHDTRNTYTNTNTNKYIHNNPIEENDNSPNNTSPVDSMFGNDREYIFPYLDSVSESSFDDQHVQILKVADKVTTHLYEYRASDVIDLEDLALLFCHYFAEVYYWGVRCFGFLYYQEIAKNYCDQPYVKPCLPQRR